MTGFAEIIIGMWLLPVTLYIILPLAMLSFWLLGRLISPKNGNQPGIARQDDSLPHLTAISPAGA
jgi:uncharacterized membrane protein